MELTENIKLRSKDAGAALLRLSESGPKTYYTHPIDCSLLDERYHHDNIKISEGHFKMMFEDVIKMNGPCLYFFEIKSTHLSNEVFFKIDEYRSNPTRDRSIPFMRKTNSASKILYVGKAEKMWGRLVTHLGFNKSKGVQGLQLSYWAKEMNLQLELTVIEFELEIKPLLAFLEVQLANHLKPIIGKHR